MEYREIRESINIYLLICSKLFFDEKIIFAHRDTLSVITYLNQAFDRDAGYFYTHFLSVSKKSIVSPPLHQFPDHYCRICIGIDRRLLCRPIFYPCDNRYYYERGCNGSNSRMQIKAAAHFYRRYVQARAH